MQLVWPGPLLWFHSGVTGALSRAVQTHHVSTFDQPSLQKRSLALTPAKGEDVSSYVVMLLRLYCHSSLMVNNTAGAVNRTLVGCC